MRYLFFLSNNNVKKILILVFLIGLGVPLKSHSNQTRLNNDIANGLPIVIHTLVALADNKNQFIVPIPESLGNGQNTRTNLYWGAMYGVKTYLTKKAGWEIVGSIETQDSRILERIILKKNFLRNGTNIPVYLVADAWDGKFISDTVKKFMFYNAGNEVLELNVNGNVLNAGGKAHLMVYIGHNVLMDFAGLKSKLFEKTNIATENPDNDAIVLACKSQPYFSPLLKNVSAHPLLLTTGLMAPEAYTLHAAINQWISGSDDNQIRKAAALSYNEFQNTGIKAAERLFGIE